VRHKRFLAQSVPGWFSPRACAMLYKWVAATEGPILEVGHFLGRSTACICEALRDSEVSREFVSYDLGFRSEDELREFYREWTSRNVAMPWAFRHLVFSGNKTTTELATENLERLGLLGYVTLVSGNFIELDSGTYNLIHCDAMHYPTEIELNLPHVVARSAPGCVWAFHDMHPPYIELVQELSGAQYVEDVDLLGVFVYEDIPV
jgi:hypothetical protein